MKTLYTLILLLAFFPVSSQFNMIETEEMSLVTYDFGHQYILKHAGRCFHNSLEFHKKLFDYEPTEKIHLLIQDFGDYGNAGATAVPRNAISMGLSPFSYAFETSPAGERVYSMMNHELVHVVALDNATKADRFYQKLFMGKVRPTADNPISMFYSYLTSPRRYSPRWYHEGIASYVETWMSGGIGLAMGSYDEMVFRTRILEDAHIYSAQGLESEGVTTDFQGRSNSYLYGTRFMGYLAYQYGPESIIEWVKRNKGSKRSFVSQFRNVYDVSINKAWKEWIAFERDWQGQNLDSLTTVPLTQTTPVRKKAIGSVSYAFHDAVRNKIYVAVNYPGQVPHIASLDLATGRLRKLIDVKGAALFYVTSMTYDAEGEVIYYSADNDSWRDLMYYDVKTGKSGRLQKNVRTGDLAFNRADKSIWGIKHLNGISTIVRIPKNKEGFTEPYSTWEQMHTLPYGHDIFDIDISPDGTLLSAAVTDLIGNQSLLLYRTAELRDEGMTPDTVFNFEITSPQSFRFTDDGKHLYGTSYYTGVSNIYSVGVDSLDLAILTNSASGLFRPVVLDDSTLFAFQFTSNGFQPVTLPNEEIMDTVPIIDFLGNITIEKHNQLVDWELPISTTAEVEIDSLITYEGTYQPGKEMHLNYAYPIVVGYKNNVGLGYKFNISDPFNFRELEFSVAYTPKEWENGWVISDNEEFEPLPNDELWHVSFRAKLGAISIDGSYNDANFYDLFGPSQGSRKGVRLGINYEKSITYDPPKVLDLRAGLSGFYGLDQSPEFQQIKASGFNRNFFLNLSSSMTYRSMKGSLGGVDAEKGIRATLWGSLASSPETGKFFPRLIGMLDYGIQLPGKHFSLWLRSTAGSSFSDIFNPFTRFGFAAFGNNYVDYQSTRRYRGPFSFAGLSYDAGRSIIAQRYAKGMAELVLPPIRFKKLGGFNFFVNWMQPSVFSSYLTSSDVLPGDGMRIEEQFANVGAQIDIRLVTFSLLPSTISVGWAKAWEVGDSPIPGLPRKFDEFMISLKLLQ